MGYVGGGEFLWDNYLLCVVFVSPCVTVYFGTFERDHKPTALTIVTGIRLSVQDHGLWIPQKGYFVMCLAKRAGEDTQWFVFFALIVQILCMYVICWVVAHPCTIITNTDWTFLFALVGNALFIQMMIKPVDGAFNVVAFKSFPGGFLLPTELACGTTPKLRSTEKPSYSTSNHRSYIFNKELNHPRQQVSLISSVENIKTVCGIIHVDIGSDCLSTRI